MKRIMGIDYGEKRIGVSLSDPFQNFAFPYKTIRNNSSLLKVINCIMKEKEVDFLVVGMPLGMKGQETKQTKIVKEFVNLLKINNISVELEDERLSSISAEKAMIQQGIKTGHNKGLIDRTAAAIILQQYLDRN